MKKYSAAFLLLILLGLGGCASTEDRLLETDESQVQLRSMQTRAFDTTDKEKTLRTVISTLQDLDFVLEKVDLNLGTVTGMKFAKNNTLKITVTVRPRNESQLLVRANAQYGIQAVKKPEAYQDFFVSLEKAMFLTAHQVD